MKRLALGLVAVLLAFSFTACSGADPSDATPVNVNNVEKVSEKGMSDTIIYDITTADGHHCFVSHGNRSGGIWCEPLAGPVTP
jgi:hypothetical protein